MHADQTPFEPPASEFGAAPPTQAGDFVPLAPPEGWPTVIGVLAIIFGSLSIIGGVCNLATLLVYGFFFGLLPAEMQEQLKDQVATSAPYPVPQAGMALVEFALAIVLLAGGVMLVRRNPKAGGVLTVFAGLDLISNTLGAVLGYFVTGAGIAAMKENPQMQQAAGFLGLMQGFGVVMVAVGWLLSAIWPVFLLIWFRRAKIRASMGAWG